ncbi:MAG: hypothetical protein Q9160_005686 [Pyrenula sp. 1 TL-2023]
MSTESSSFFEALATELLRSILDYCDSREWIRLATVSRRLSVLAVPLLDTAFLHVEGAESNLPSLLRALNQNTSLRSQVQNLVSDTDTNLLLPEILMKLPNLKSLVLGHSEVWGQERECWDGEDELETVFNKVSLLNLNSPRPLGSIERLQMSLYPNHGSGWELAGYLSVFLLPTLHTLILERAKEEGEYHSWDDVPVQFGRKTSLKSLRFEECDIVTHELRKILSPVQSLEDFTMRLIGCGHYAYTGDSWGIDHLVEILQVQKNTMRTLVLHIDHLDKSKLYLNGFPNLREFETEASDLTADPWWQSMETGGLKLSSSLEHVVLWFSRRESQAGKPKYGHGSKALNDLIRRKDSFLPQLERLTCVVDTSRFENVGNEFDPELEQCLRESKISYVIRNGRRSEGTVESSILRKWPEKMAQDQPKNNSFVLPRGRSDMYDFKR